MNNSNTNAWFFLGAALIGVVSAATVFLVEQVRQDKKRHAVNRDLARLDGQLSSLRKELDALRALQKERNESIKERPTRRRVRAAVSSAVSTTTEEYNSALDVDSSDLEFYDLSSDEDSGSERLVERDLVDVDLKLQDENSQDAQFALEKLNSLKEKYPRNTDILWRIAKAHKILANQATDEEEKKTHILVGVEACENAVSLKPNSALCHKWMAILVGMKSEISPTKEKILNGYTFKKHLDIALEITPHDPLLHHMLGRFAYEIAQLSWLEKTVAKSLFAEVPNMTMNDALDYFLKAEQFSEKDWKENKLFIAKCSIAAGNTDEAVQWLSKADCSSSIEDDKVHEEIKSLLEKYGSKS